MSTTPTSRPLTKAQIEYASQRIREIRSDKITTFTNALPKLPDAPAPITGYNSDEKMAFIRAGKATMKAPDQVYYRTDLVEAFTYPERKRTPADIKKQAVYDKACEVRTAAISKYATALDKQVTTLQDKLHLGDSAATLALIDAFAAA